MESQGDDLTAAMDRLELFVLTATESALKKSMAHFGCRQVVSPRFFCRIFVGFLGEIIFSMFDIHTVVIFAWVDLWLPFENIT